MKRFIAFLSDHYDHSGAVGSYAGDFDTVEALIVALPARAPDEDRAASDLDVLDTSEGVWFCYDRHKGSDGKPYWRLMIKLTPEEGSQFFDTDDA